MLKIFKVRQSEIFFVRMSRSYKLVHDVVGLMLLLLLLLLWQCWFVDTGREEDLHTQCLTRLMIGDGNGYEKNKAPDRETQEVLNL